jgi:SpoVK/Ycf46/Vps4 family AAA+-type ATPase
MAAFNFEIKRQSYQMAVQRTGEALRAGDVAEGRYYLSKAIELVSQLVENCIIDHMRDAYAAEHRKLIALSAALDRGENPFTAPKAAPAPRSGGNATPAAPRRSNPAAADGEEGEGAEGYEFFSSDPPSVTLDDVAGLEDVKKQIRLSVIAPMSQPDLYGRYMDEAGCQILMYGPPGCGKSFVAEAIAGELGCAYAILNASDLLDKYVGEGSKKVTRIFKEAAQFDNCLIFFDELDSVFASRESDDSKHSKDVLTTFLTCLSGFGAKKGNGIKVIIGATNRPWALDSALVRGKRFDTHVYVGLPDYDARHFLVKKAFKGKESLLEGSDLTIEALTDMFDGYSGADISAIMGKIKVRALERALDNRLRGEDDNVPVTMADAKAVLADYRNSVTPESLLAFEAFKNGEL